MQSRLVVDENQHSLAELLDRLAAGAEVVLTRDQLPVARLIGEPARPRQPRQPGNCQGMITLLMEDDEHLAGFIDPSPLP